MSDTMRERMGKVVSELIENDPKRRSSWPTSARRISGMSSRRFPERAINLGIMEQTMVSVAAGFAMEGFHPIVHSIAPFVVERPFEQIKDDFCYQGLGGTFISIGASYDYGTDGMTHQAPGDVSIMKTLPGCRCVCRAHRTSSRRCCARPTAMARRPTSAPVRRRTTPAVLSSFGKLHLEREGKDGVVVAVGPMLDRTLAAVEDMDLTVLYATTVAPFDEETLRRAVAKAAPNVILVEPYYEGGLVQDIARRSRQSQLGSKRSACRAAFWIDTAPRSATMRRLVSRRRGFARASAVSSTAERSDAGGPRVSIHRPAASDAGHIRGPPPMHSARGFAPLGGP